MLRELNLGTVFHGPKFAAIAKTRFDAAVWIFVVAVCALLFVADLKDIFQTYVDCETLSSFRLERTAGVTLPQPVLCVEFDRKLFTAGFVDDFVKGSKSTRDFELLIQHPNGSDACSIDDIVTSSSRRVMEATYLLLTLYMDYDLENSHYEHLYRSKRLRRLLRILEACFERTNVDLFQLARSVAATICTWFGFRDYAGRPASSATRARRFLQCDPNATVWLGPSLLANAKNTSTDLFCHNYFGRQQADDSSSFVLQHPIILSYAYIGLFEHTVYKHEATKSKIVFLIGRQRLIDPHGPELSTARLVVDVDGGAGIMDPNAKDKAVAFFPIYTVMSVQIRTQSAFEHYPARGGLPCGKRSRFECAKECKMAAIVNARKCWPLSFFQSAKIPPNATACKVERRTFGERSGGEKKEITSWQACLDSCPIQCNVQLFNVAQIEETAMYIEYFSGLTIAPEPIPFPVITERPKLDLAGLFAAIGGSAGLWLGGSLFALVHAMVLPIQYLIRAQKVRKPSSAAHAEHAAAADDTSAFARCWRHFDAFCERSPLHGVCFIGREKLDAQSGNSTSSSVWLSLTLIFFLITIRDVAQLVDKFNAEPVVLTTSIVKNETALLANLSLCFHVNFENVIAHVAVVADNDTLANETLASLSTPAVVDLLKDGGHPDDAKRIPNSLLLLLYAELLSVTSASHGCTFRYSTFHYLYGNGRRGANISVAALKKAALLLNEVRSHLHGTSNDMLNKFFAVFFCRIRNVSFTVRRFDEHLGIYADGAPQALDEICRVGRFRWFADCDREASVVTLRTCVRLPARAFEPSVADKLRVGYELHEKDVDVLAGTVSVTLDFRGGAGTANPIDADGMSRSDHLFVVVGGELNLENRTASSCTSSSNDSGDHRDCLEECYWRAMLAARNCTPVQYARFVIDHKEAKFCDRHVELAIEDRNYSGAINSIEASLWDHCTVDCRRQCGVRLYSLQRQAPVEYNFICMQPTGCPENRRKQIGVSIRHRSFLRVSERLEMRVEDALISFGGAIALWFGGSVLALLHIPLHIVLALWRRGDNKSEALAAVSIESESSRPHEEPAEAAAHVDAECSQRASSSSLAEHHARTTVVVVEITHKRRESSGSFADAESARPHMRERRTAWGTSCCSNGQTATSGKPAAPAGRTEGTTVYSFVTAVDEDNVEAEIEMEGPEGADIQLARTEPMDSTINNAASLSIDDVVDDAEVLEPETAVTDEFDCQEGRYSQQRSSADSSMPIDEEEVRVEDNRVTCARLH